MKSLFIVVSVVLFIGFACVAPVSAEVDRVPAINTAADKAVIIPKTVLDLSSVFLPAQVVVEVEDGAFFLLASKEDPAYRQVFIYILTATLKEQLHVDSDVTNYESFSIVKVTAATAEQVEPILLSLVGDYLVGSWFTCGGAYSFPW